MGGWAAQTARMGRAAACVACDGRLLELSATEAGLRPIHGATWYCDTRPPPEDVVCWHCGVNASAGSWRPSLQGRGDVVACSSAEDAERRQRYHRTPGGQQRCRGTACLLGLGGGRVGNVVSPGRLRCHRREDGGGMLRHRNLRIRWDRAGVLATSGQRARGGGLRT